jgi:predicted CoA-binding protein
MTGGRILSPPFLASNSPLPRASRRAYRREVDSSSDLLGDLRRLLADSTDRANPSAEALRDLLARTRRIAVVGISRFPEKPARSVPAYLAARGYEIVPVNPKADRVLGRKAYPRLADVDGPVDMVMIFRPSEQAGAFVREAAARPERPAIWLSEGIRADAAVDAARAQGITAVQDLCAYRAYEAIRPDAGSPP